MKKILRIFLVVALLALVSACENTVEKIGSSSDIENAFIKNESLDKYKLEMIIKSTGNESNDSIEKKYTYYMNFEDQTAYFIDNVTGKKSYIMKDCITDEYNIEYLPWDEFTGDKYLSRMNPSSYNFNSERLDIKYSTKEGVTEYIITIPDDYLNEFIKEKFFDDEYRTITYTNYVITMKTDKNGYWTSLNLAFNYVIETTYDKSSGKMYITYNLLATGDDAFFYIPKEIKECIYSFYDRHTYDGPRSYQYDRNLDLESLNLPHENTDVITYHDNINNISYFDKVSKTLFVTGWESKSVYDANTAEKSYDLSTWSSTKYAYGNGLLVEIEDIGNSSPSERYKITTLDLKTNTTIKSIEISGEYLYFFSYNVSGNILIMDTNYVSDWGTAFINTTTGSMYYSEGVLGSTNRLINYDHNILYCENSSSTYYNGESLLQFVDINTGKVMKTIKATGIASNQKSNLTIIGNSLFFYDKIYDLVTGELISDSPLMKNYSTLIGFTPIRTIYADDKYDIVSGYCESGYEVAIYDNEINKYVFRAGGEFGSAEYDDRIFYLLTFNGFATVDTTKIIGELESNLDSDIRVTKDAFGKITKLNFPGNYTDLVIDGDYLFVALGNIIKVYDLNTFELIKEITFAKDVYCLDAYENILAVSFGQKYSLFTLTEIDNWERSNVTTEKGVTDIQVYNNKIYFTGKDVWDNIICYDMTTKKTSKVEFTNFSHPYFTVNKEEGILYIAETGISGSDYAYIDLNANEIIYESSTGFGYNYFPIIYDGTYVHYYGFMFDSSTGDRLYKDDYEKMFPSLEGYEFLGAIYFDGETSVVVALKNEQKMTLIYDLTTGSIVETAGDAERVIRNGDQFIIVRPNRDVLFIID